MQVEVFGPWSFVLQSDTPILWLRCPRLSHYLLKMNVRYISKSDSNHIRAGVVVHSSAESEGRQGVTVWIDHHEESKKLAVRGDGLRESPDCVLVTESAEEVDETWEVYVRGEEGFAFFDNKKYKIQFKMSDNYGNIGKHSEVVSSPIASPVSKKEG